MAGNTITVDGTTFTFVASGATGNQLNVTDTVGTCSSKIDVDHRQSPPSINASTGAITLTSGTAARTLSVTQHQRRQLSGRSALHTTSDGGAHRRRHRRHRHRDRQRPHDFRQRIDQRRRGHGLQRGGNAGEPATALGQDRQRSLGGAPGHLESVLSDRSTATGTQAAWVNVGTNFTFNSNGALSSVRPARRSPIPNVTVERSIARQRLDQLRLRRSDAICQHRRHRDHQQHHAERLCRRPASVGRDQQQRARGRHVLQRAEHRSRRGHAVALQRHQLPARPSTAAPMR